MSAVIVTDLYRRGVALEAHGDQIHFKGRLSDEDRELIRGNKAAILEALRKPPAPVPVNAHGYPAGPCADCHERHFWRDADGWRCSDCCRVPNDFLGETATLPSGRYPAQEGAE